MSILAELHRRNVIRVGLAYLAGAWLLIQVLETLFPIFSLDATAVRVVVIILAIGFIPTLVLVWVFELTPEGLKRDGEVDRSAIASATISKRLDRTVMVMLTVALGYFAFDKFVLDPARDRRMVEEAAVQARASALTESFGEQSIAVLPFSDMSPDSSQEYLADGIAEELLNLLANVSELRVTSRSSAFSFKDKAVDIPTVARQLNVAHVLEGSVRKSGDRLRITAKLIDARSDTQIWTESYDRTMGDIFAIQDDIAADVVDQLKVTLLAPIPKVRETDAEAYRLYLQGLYITNHTFLENIAEAESLFRQALELDPEFAPAWNELGRVLWRQIGSGPSLHDDIRRAREPLARSLELDPGDAGTLAYAAYNALEYEGNAVRAAEMFETAFSVDPDNENVTRTILQFAIAVDRPDEAIRIGEYGYVRNPLCYYCNRIFAEAYRNSGRLDEAERILRDAQGVYGGQFDFLGVVLLLKGEEQAAVDTFRQLPIESLRMIRIAMVESDTQALDEIAAMDLPQGFLQQEVIQRIAEAYAWLGHTDEAFATIDRLLNAFRSGPEADAAIWNRIRVSQDLRSPLFRSLHADPRWQSVLESQGVSAAQLEGMVFRVSLPD